MIINKTNNLDCNWSLALLVGRMNPPHIWHIRVIEAALRENSKVLILLGSANKIDQENVFSFEERKFFLTEYFQDETTEWRLVIDKINDVIDNEIWVQNIWNTIKLYCPSFKNTLNVYGWDLKEDTAIKILKEHQKESGIKKIKYKEIYRNYIQISHNWVKHDISGTNLRKALASNDYDLAKEYIPTKIADLQIKKRIEKHNEKNMTNKTSN